MKTKLSFLALPLCLGLALTFVLAACSSGSGSKPDEGNSSNSNNGGTPYSSNVQDEDGFITFDPDDPSIGVDRMGNKYYLQGTISSPNRVPIKKLEFITTGSGWISYKDEPVTRPIDLDVNYIYLVDAEINLTNSSIPCGTHRFTVKVCLDAACSTGKFGTKNGTFEKPADEFCLSSSAGGGGVSSSSEVKWRFGTKETASVGDGGSRSIGSASITLKDEKVNGADTPYMTVTNGRVRYAGINFDIDSFVNGYPQSNIDYPNNIFHLESSQTKTDVQINEYYLIITNSGDKYLVRVEPRDGPDGAQSLWPKVVHYWKAEGGPESL